MLVSEYMKEFRMYPCVQKVQPLHTYLEDKEKQQQTEEISSPDKPSKFYELMELEDLYQTTYRVDYCRYKSRMQYYPNCVPKNAPFPGKPKTLPIFEKEFKVPKIDCPKYWL